MTEVRFTCSRSGCAIWSNCGCKIQLPTRLSAILSWRGPKGWRLHMMPQFPPYWIPPKNSQHAMFSKNGHVIIVRCHVFTDALTSWKHVEYHWRSKLAQSLSPETCKKTRPWASSDSAVTLGPGSCGGRWQFRQRNLPGPAKLLEVLGLQASACSNENFLEGPKFQLYRLLLTGWKHWKPLFKSIVEELTLLSNTQTLACKSKQQS